MFSLFVHFHGIVVIDDWQRETIAFNCLLLESTGRRRDCSTSMKRNVTWSTLFVSFSIVFMPRNFIETRNSCSMTDSFYIHSLIRYMWIVEDQVGLCLFTLWQDGEWTFITDLNTIENEVNVARSYQYRYFSSLLIASAEMSPIDTWFRAMFDQFIDRTSHFQTRHYII
jgi:hypothetical protein